MMSLKDLIKKDVEDTFFNVNEFAEKIDINGDIHVGVLDYREDISSKIRGDGILESDEIFLYLKHTNDFEKSRFKKGKSIEVNDESFVIESVSKQDGMIVFKLTRNEGY